MIYAVRNDQGYWVGVWNVERHAQRIAERGMHGERIVQLYEPVTLGKIDEVVAATVPMEDWDEARLIYRRILLQLGVPVEER